MRAPTQIDLHSMLEEVDLEDIICAVPDSSEHFK
jgi:hypothetical protein